MNYETIQYETWSDENNLLKQIKIIKTWSSNGILINTVTANQSQSEIEAYIIQMNEENNINEETNNI